jgi:hypothetical protein
VRAASRERDVLLAALLLHNRASQTLYDDSGLRAETPTRQVRSRNDTHDCAVQVLRTDGRRAVGAGVALRGRGGQDAPVSGEGVRAMKA